MHQLENCAQKSNHSSQLVTHTYIQTILLHFHFQWVGEKRIKFPIVMNWIRLIIHNLEIYLKTLTLTWAYCAQYKASPSPLFYTYLYSKYVCVSWKIGKMRWCDVAQTSWCITQDQPFQIHCVLHKIIWPAKKIDADAVCWCESSELLHQMETVFPLSGLFESVGFRWSTKVLIPNPIALRGSWQQFIFGPTLQQQ